MTDEQLFDEQMVAKIIAAAEGKGVAVAPNLVSGFGVTETGPGYSTYDDEPQGPVCAVGAGVLYRNVVDNSGTICDAFARIHGVSLAFAAGVSDGFECSKGTAGDMDSGSPEDYSRGCSVGEAVRAYFEDAQ